MVIRVGRAKAERCIQGQGGTVRLLNLKPRPRRFFGMRMSQQTLADVTGKPMPPRELRDIDTKQTSPPAFDRNDPDRRGSAILDQQGPPGLNRDGSMLRREHLSGPA